MKKPAPIQEFLSKEHPSPWTNNEPELRSNFDLEHPASPFKDIAAPLSLHSSLKPFPNKEIPFEMPAPKTRTIPMPNQYNLTQDMKRPQA